MPIETETSAQGRRKKIVAGPAFDIETNNGLTASNKLLIGMASAGIGLFAWFVGERVSPTGLQRLPPRWQRVLDDLVVRSRNSETQLAVLRAENDDRLAAMEAKIDDRLAALQAENDDRLAALQAENDVLRRELADARAEIDVLRGNPTS